MFPDLVGPTALLELVNHLDPAEERLPRPSVCPTSTIGALPAFTSRRPA
ncbi:MAG: hypothetical protein H3C27_14925 [Opitutaceae bacterium]|nr:hypothetical protein [Opitutaceae bacterium]